jgi:uncharacterized protein YjbI with pentapeptide repeats
MANDEHVAKLKEGVEAWNKWRVENRDVAPDLDEANLGGEFLSDADLSSAHLNGANLSRTQLKGANLSNATLIKANLSEAILNGAQLNGANLSESNLINATLADTNARGPDLRGVNFSGANLTGLDLNGTNLRNVNLSGAHLSGAHLQKAALREVNFTGANLNSADLTGAVLRSTTLNKAQLVEAKLGGADLTNVSFQGSVLERAMFDIDAQYELRYDPKTKLSQLAGATFRDADLRSAKLKSVIGMSGSAMAGAILTNSELPENIKEFAALKHVEENSKHARNIFLAMVGACVYVWLTIATTTDAALLTNSSGTPLPIISAPIPIAWFYWVVPAILLTLYFYLHFYMQSMWEGLGKLPAIFPDGRRLEETTYPWLLTCLVPAYMALLKENRQALFHAKVGLSIVAAWLLVPATILGCWIRYLPKHDWIGSLLLMAALTVSVWSGVAFFRRMRTTLQGNEADSSLHVLAVEAMTSWLILLVATSISWAAFNSTERLSLFGFATWAELTEKDVSTKPANWSGLPKPAEQEAYRKALALVKGANLKYANLRFSQGHSSFLVNADLRHAKLQGANFRFANLQGADLRYASLQGADLEIANLQGADLRFANLHGARLWHANLQGADLSGVNLRETGGLTKEQLSEACSGLDIGLPMAIDVSGFRMRPCHQGLVNTKSSEE